MTPWWAALRAHVAWRRLGVVLVTGLVASALALGAVRLGERALVGRTPQLAREHTIDRARRSVQDAATALRAASTALALGAMLDNAAQGDEDALRDLFARVGTIVTGGQRVDGITVYGADRQALAWAGRPSEVTLGPADALPGGTERWLLQQGSTGPTLLYVAPVALADGRPAGTIVSERALEGVPNPNPGAFDLRVGFGMVPATLWLPGATPDAAPAERFQIVDPRGQTLAVGSVTELDHVRTEQRWIRAGSSLALALLAVTALLLCGPILGGRSSGSPIADGVRLLVCAGALVAARALLALASPADYLDAALFSGSAYASSLAAPFLASPFDFLASGLLVGALALLAATAFERARALRLLKRWTAPGHWGARGLAVYATAGVLALAIVVLHRALVWDTVSSTVFDLLHLSLHPWDWARVGLQLGLVVWHVTTVGCVVLVLRVAHALTPLSRTWPQRAIGLVWLAPALLWVSRTPPDEPSRGWVLVVLIVAAALSLRATAVLRLLRHGSQAARLIVPACAMVVAAIACYPIVFAASSRATQELIETRYAPQALNQRQTIQRLLQESLAQIDSLPSLSAAVTATPGGSDEPLASEAAFEVWQATNLARYPVTSSVELYGPTQNLIGRFAFNLPEDLAVTPQVGEVDCSWSIYEEVSPFFAEQRRVLHAGRSVCTPEAPNTPARVVGAIVVHAMLDFENLPFIASQSPYAALLRPGNARDEGGQATNLEYAVYGWSGRPLYASGGPAWVLGPDAIRQIADSRTPTWLTVRRDNEQYRAYALNDRGGIYVLGVPVLSGVAHLVNAAEVTVLACLVYLGVLLMAMVFELASGRPTNGAAFLREVRASFYRKLFLAFVAASVVPVVTLALLTSGYVASELRANIELEAVRTAATARRVVEDLMAPRSALSRDAIDDNLMVWVSRLIDQDVNVFRGTRLQATSERNLFASGVLGVRTPADAYASLVLGRQATAIVTERVGTLTYLIAATPLSAGQFDGFLTVPLTLRQQDIERRIDTLNRLVVLGALLLILAGAGIGYSMAERIADPINRLTRATRRIALGHLDEHVTTTSVDELGRLVHDFNKMASELRQQRVALERTHRVEAWAEMARQVAHEIKNPLTPIQLNAEHLRRIHHDRGRPLSPVLDECVDTILRQVALLRTIASEFSNFASTPTVRRAPTAVGDLVEEIVAPYRGALADRVAMTVEVAPDLPAVVVDRVLLGRALANLVENALHAMPNGGSLAIECRPDAAGVRVTIADTGVGMEPSALARAFEPYFSTKTTGTGLGLPIAKRNIELSGGTVSMTSAVGQGTTVTVTLPTAQA